MHHVRAAARAFEMSNKMRVINPFTYLGWLVYPLIIAILGLLILAHGSAAKTAYAILGGGLIGYWGLAYQEGGNEIQNERWFGTLEQVMACPTPLAVIVVGKIASSLLFGLLSFIPTVLAAYFLWHVSLQSVDPVPFAVSFVVLTFSFFSVAIALAPLYAMWRWSNALINGFEIGMFALCGFMFPVSQLPQWLQPFSAVLAPAWATRSLYAATGQPDAHAYFLWCGIAIAISCGYLLISWFLFRLVDLRARVTGQLALV
jgi:ABC-2 type transport system permease protein